MSISISKPSLVDHIKSALPMIIPAIIVLLLDQFTKAIVRKYVAPVELIEVIKGFFEISYAENTGAAFGTFAGQNRIFIVVGFIAIIFMLLYYRQFKESLWMKIALGFLLGGAMGNLVDRLVFHYVTDFIRVRYWLFQLRWWPSYNIADAAVFIGAVMLIIGIIRSGRLSEVK